MSKATAFLGSTDHHQGQPGRKTQAQNGHSNTRAPPRDPGQVSLPALLAQKWPTLAVALLRSEPPESDLTLHMHFNQGKSSQGEDSGQGTPCTPGCGPCPQQPSPLVGHMSERAGDL